MNAVRLTAVAVLTCFFATTTAHAKPKQKAAAADTRGRDEFEKAARFYKAQEYEAALPWFQKAYELSEHRASTIRALAQCERSLKMYDEAIKHFREYLATNPPASEQKSVRTTIELLDEMRASRDIAAATRSAQQPEEELTPPIGAAPVITERRHTETIEITPEIKEPPVETKPVETKPAVREIPKIEPPVEHTPPITETQVHTTVHHRSRALPWIVTGSGAAMAIVGGTLLALGRSDISKVESAADGTPFKGEIADAAGRAPAFTGLGTGLLIAGLAGTGIGIAWLVGQDDDEELVTGTTIQTGGAE